MNEIYLSYYSIYLLAILAYINFKDNSPWTIVQINLMRCAVPVSNKLKLLLEQNDVSLISKLG